MFLYLIEMPIEDGLNDIIKKLNHFLEENVDVDNQEWYLCLARGTTYIEKALEKLECYNQELEKEED